MCSFDAVFDCLCHVSVRRHSQSWNRRQTEQNNGFFGPNALVGTSPTFLRQNVSAIYCPPSGKVWSRSGKNASPILSRLWTKFHEIFRRCRRSSYFQKHCLHRLSFRRYLSTVWQSLVSSICWSPSAMPGIEVECWNYGWSVKTPVQLGVVCGPKFMSFWDEIGDPL